MAPPLPVFVWMGELCNSVLDTAKAQEKYNTSWDYFILEGGKYINEEWLEIYLHVIKKSDYSQQHKNYIIKTRKYIFRILYLLRFFDMKIQNQILQKLSQARH